MEKSNYTLKIEKSDACILNKWAVSIELVFLISMD